MAERTHLTRRKGGTYAVRIRVPDDLRSKIGKQEIWETLDTTDLATANRRKLPVVHRILAHFDNLRRVNKPTAEDLQWIARDHYEEALNVDSRLRMRDGAAVVRFHALFGPGYLEEIRNHLAIGENVLVADAAEHWLRLKGFSPDTESFEFKRLCQYLARTEIELETRKRERDAGDFTGKPKDSLLAAELKSVNRDARKPLSELLPSFHRERAGMTRASREIQRSVVEAFEEFLGHKKPVAAITKQDVIDFKAALLETPSNRGKRFPGSTIHEAIRKNKALEKPYAPLDPKTINDSYLAHTRAVLNWCVEQNLIPFNPADKVKVHTSKRKRTQRARYPFSESHLRAIFGSPMFAAGARRDARFWAILIAAYQGLRATEIAQLEVADITTVKGVSCLHLRYWSDEGDAPTKSLKTAAARHVPIHPELIKVGLLRHVARMKKAGEQRLLPDWKPNVRGDYSQTVPRWVNQTFLPSIGINHPGKLVFHSLRHTFKDAARAAGVPKDVNDFLTGHIPTDVAGGYGVGHTAAIEVVARELARVQLEGVDLSHLHITS